MEHDYSQPEAERYVPSVTTGTQTELIGHKENEMFIYHYCATKQLGQGREVVIDGIAQVEQRVTTMDDYCKFKDLIANIDDGIDIGGAGGLTIRSLTLI